MTLDLDELERKAKDGYANGIGALLHWRSTAEPEYVLALIERVRAAEGALKSCNVANANLVKRVEELERVAKAVRGITKDIVDSGRNCADCPYVEQEEARELLAIIDGVKSA